jgi:acetyl/propionyl-CoA carboxylase alpha subunit/acetyl-CoA carboxylase carboxyltransferase component
MTVPPSQPLFKRVAILNRGEPALRFLRALREYNIERGTSIKGISLYTDPDSHAPFVRQADEAVPMGDPMRSTEAGGSISSYCDHNFVLGLLREHSCDAVWPGWGFLSEDPSFVARLEEEGITFIGPSSEAMYRLGDKIASKYMAAACGVPLAPWVELTEMDDAKTLLAHGQQIGYPLMVKASAGGGGRGIIKVTAAEDLLPSIRSVREQVAKIFGQGGVLLEACVSGARHVEVQMVANGGGEAFAIGVRDCSIQRKNQKVIEEAPSPVLPSAVEELLCSVSARLAKHAGYCGVGTAEFLYEPISGDCTFLEVNSRLQVEHTITELVMGCDLVKAQIDIAMGRSWVPPEGGVRGHAIEVRVNAENPEKDFQPSPGMLRIFRFPSGPGVRVDSGVMEGMEIAPHFDSMIAKIIAWAPTRKQAIARVLRACKELEVVVEDGATNQAFLCDVLQHSAFVDGSADTAWLDRAMKEGGVGVIAREAEALAAAAILEYRMQLRSDLSRFFSQVQDGMPQQVPPPKGRQVDLRLRGAPWQLWVYAIEDSRYLVGTEGNLHDVSFDVLSPGIAELRINGERNKILYSYGSAGIAVEVDGNTHPVERASGGVVRSPSPAVVVVVSVQEGDMVEVGDRLCTLEAMKMEMGVTASEGGLVKTILCRPNQQVAVGQPLLLLEPQGEGEGEEAVAASTEFPVARPSPIEMLRGGEQLQPLRMDELTDAEAERVVGSLCRSIRGLMLGFEVPYQEELSIETLFEQDFRRMEKPHRWLPMLSLLQMFADTGHLLDRNVILEAEGEAALPADVAFYDFCRRHHEGEEGAIAPLVSMLERALAWYGVSGLEASAELREALFRISVAHHHSDSRHRLCSSIMRALIQLHEAGLKPPPSLKETLEGVALTAKDKFPFVRDNAVQADYVFFDRQKYALHAKTVEEFLESIFGKVTQLDPTHRKTRAAMNELVGHPHSLQQPLLRRSRVDSPERFRVLEALTRRLYIGSLCQWIRDLPIRSGAAIRCDVSHDGKTNRLLAVLLDCNLLSELLTKISQLERSDLLEIIFTDPLSEGDPLLEASFSQVIAAIQELPWKPSRLTFTWRCPVHGERHSSFFLEGGEIKKQELLRNIHPEAARRVELWRLQNFNLTRLDAHDRVYAFLGQATSNPKDERIFVCSEVFGGLFEDKDEPFWPFEQVFFEAVGVLREAQSKRTKRTRLRYNWLHFYIHTPFRITQDLLSQMANRLEPHTRSLNIREVNIRARLLPDNPYEPPRNIEIIIRKPGSFRLELEVREPSTKAPILEMDPYDMRVVRARRTGNTYPYEIVRMLEGRDRAMDTKALHPDITKGQFKEYDLGDGGLVPVDRGYGKNSCGIVVGLISNVTRKFPKGMERVWIGSDPTRAMGALAEPECRRIIAAIDLAEERGLPVEWIPVSAGAKIAMDSGTENLDWTAQVLRRIVEFSQKGGQINLIVHGINVGAQSYWNAEATMLMHTRGVLIMTMTGSMVLTGKKALDFSGGVSAEDERGIGGAERIMGTNGQAQFIASDLGEAYSILFDWYQFTYCQPGEKGPRRFPTQDPPSRSVLNAPYSNGGSFTRVGEIFDASKNPGRKTPFSIREVMRSVIDNDGGSLERFGSMKDGESAVVWETHLGGYPVCMLGIESRPIMRRGRIPMDGPDKWTGGTLFPQSSKKVARAINAASGNRPVVALANLSGFDGSPESMRKLQLELGAEIGRAVVNFKGPIIFVVIGRYHGGAYVVFSKALNPKLRALAVEGSFASVIGGAPAAAVVFPREVSRRVVADPRIKAAEDLLSKAPAIERPILRERLEETRTDVMLEKRGEVAAEFDAIHSVQRAVEVGSLDRVITAAELRPAIIQELDQALMETVPLSAGGLADKGEEASPS